MESIDALRKYVDGNSYINEVTASCICSLLDAIESEVKANRVDAYTKGYDEGFASADDWAAQHEDAMAEHGWVRLPLDADGKPIRIGDVMEWPDCYTAEVVGIGDDRFFYVDDCLMYAWTNDKIHHHAPTVEDVLRDYASRILIVGCIDEEDELVAEYAAKLRLAGDE